MTRRSSLRILALISSLVVLGVACTGGGGTNPSGGGSGAPVQITLWHGYGNIQAPNGTVNYEAKALTQLVARFNATHPDIKVNAAYVGVNDNALTKLTTALQAGKQPDITYQYGTSMPQLATAPGVMDLTDTVKQSDWHWNDFFPGERAAATVDGHVYGIPALVDNLAIVYNKQLFDQAGVAYPTPQWTWSDFAAAAKKLTDPSKKVFGFGFPADASEDTVWHFDAMMWGAGGSILNSDDTKATFNAPPGVEALTTLQQMAVTDKSVYLDQSNTKLQALMNSGKLGMLITGPWDLSSLPDIQYGVQIMPAYPDGTHASISGPDMWVLFNNGDARSQAALTFMQWFTSTPQVLENTMVSGDLPTVSSVTAKPGFLAAFGKKFPGEDVFATNLANVPTARPVLRTYDQISQQMGTAIVEALLGQASPKAALDKAAQQADQILSGG